MAVKTYGSVSDAREELVKEYASVNNTRKELKKVYGSVNNQRKLIHTSTPPTPPVVPYGIVYYKTNPNDLETKSVELASAAEFNSLCNGGSLWTTTVGSGSVTLSNSTTNVIVGIDIGTDITTIGSDFLHACSYFNMPLTIPDTVTTINDFFLEDCTSFNQALVLSNSLTFIDEGFLSGCSAFNQPLSVPNGVTGIGIGFIQYCSSFNQTLTLPNTVTSIEEDFLLHCTAFNQLITLPTLLTRIEYRFLKGCTSFNQNLTLPNSLTLVQGDFMSECTAMVSTVDVGSLAATIAESDNDTFATTDITAPMYTTGITIAGSNRSAWLSRFPDRASSPYRKLLDAGY